MKLIDADAVMDIINRPSMMRKSDMRYAIKHLPTIDAVSVVRCKECKHCNEWEHPNGIELYCNNPNVDPFDWGGSISFYVKADDFCSYGEREGE